MAAAGIPQNSSLKLVPLSINAFYTAYLESVIHSEEVCLEALNH